MYWYILRTFKNRWTFSQKLWNSNIYFFKKTLRTKTSMKEVMKAFVLYFMTQFVKALGLVTFAWFSLSARGKNYEDIKLVLYLSLLYRNVLEFSVQLFIKFEFVYVRWTSKYFSTPVIFICISVTNNAICMHKIFTNIRTNKFIENYPRLWEVIKLCCLHLYL